MDSVPAGKPDGPTAEFCNPHIPQITTSITAPLNSTRVVPLPHPYHWLSRRRRRRRRRRTRRRRRRDALYRHAANCSDASMPCEYCQQDDRSVVCRALEIDMMPEVTDQIGPAAMICMQFGMLKPSMPMFTCINNSIVEPRDSYAIVAAIETCRPEQ